MSKVKIVQIAGAGAGDEYDFRYLDDRGRVWYWGETFKGMVDGKATYKAEWKQIDLPEEPDAGEVPF